MAPHCQQDEDLLSPPGHEVSSPQPHLVSVPRHMPHVCRQFPCLEAPLPPPRVQSACPAEPQLMFPWSPSFPWRQPSQAPATAWLVGYLSPLCWEGFHKSSSQSGLGVGGPPGGVLGMSTQILLLPCFAVISQGRSVEGETIAPWDPEGLPFPLSPTLQELGEGAVLPSG